jgi:hypothetical protein
VDRLAAHSPHCSRLFLLLLPCGKRVVPCLILVGRWKEKLQTQAVPRIELTERTRISVNHPRSTLPRGTCKFSRWLDSETAFSDPSQMYNLLFFLPIYYQIVKQHSQINTSLLLLPQTLLVAPCGVVVYALVRKGNLSCHWVVLLGWLCTSGGIGLLAMLGMQKTVTADVLLNLLSGFGVGTLLPALTLSAKHAAHGASAQGLMVLTYIRYLGSASGLVVTGIVFQRVLRQNLAYTEFGNEATELTKHAMTLMYSIHDMPDSQNKLVLIQATQDTLRTIWIGLSILCAGLFLLSCLTTVIVVCRKETDKLVNQNSVPDSNRTSITKLDPVLITEFKHGFGDFNSDQFPKL